MENANWLRVFVNRNDFPNTLIDVGDDPTFTHHCRYYVRRFHATLLTADPSMDLVTLAQHHQVPVVLVDDGLHIELLEDFKRLKRLKLPVYYWRV